MYMPNAKTQRQGPNATYIPLDMGFAFATQREEIYTKKINVHGRRKKFVSPNARDTNMLVFLALGNAKVLSFAIGDAKVPNARSFAFWWNIGLTREKDIYFRTCAETRDCGCGGGKGTILSAVVCGALEARGVSLQYARMCVSKSEGHGYFFGLK